MKSNPIRTVSSLLLAVVLALVFVPAAQAAPASIANGDEFNGTQLDSAWQVSHGWTFRRSTSRAENVSVHDGVLDIRVRRHCVSNDREPLTDANHHPGVCPAGMKTKYSNGRITSGYGYSTPGVFEVRAKLDDRHHGIFANAWLHNDQPFCGDGVRRSQIAELDVMEMWQADSAKITTHMSCVGDDYKSQQVGVTKNFADGQFHTWRVEFDGHKVNYFVDGQLLSGQWGPHIAGFGLDMPQDEFVSLMTKNPWQIVIETSVQRNAAWSPTIDDSQPFADLHTLFDYVRFTPLNPATAAKHPTVPVWGGIGERFWTSGGLNGPLGWPMGDEYCLPGGCRQDFQAGSITWTARRGAHLLGGAIGAKYDELGGPSKVGWPTSDEQCRGDGCYQDFEQGRIYWSGKTGAHFMTGAIHAHYLAIGGRDSFLGYPISDELCGHRDRGCIQIFQNSNGHIFWSSKSGAWETGGAIHTVYSDLAWEWGPLGYPVGAESCYTIRRITECTQVYQGGRIRWNPRLGGWATIM